MSGALMAAVQAALPAWLAVHALHRGSPAVTAQRERWAAVMTAALGPGFRGDDSLFVRHALLVRVAREVGRALGVEVATDELAGCFAWAEDAAVTGLAEVDWEVEEDVLRPVYAALITAEERKGAGEHYTPDWLARRVVAEVMGSGTVMDPSCGSGTFVFHAVRRALAEPGATVEAAVRRVRGMDIHPVAVVLARANYVLALGRRARGSAVNVPIRRGDAMCGDMEAVDVLLGNPPWLAYRFMPAAAQAAFRVDSAALGLWAGGAVSTHQDLCGLFVVRVVERYLKAGGRFGFVMPAAALDRAQYAGFRGGEYGGSLCVEFAAAWDLRRVRPHMFPVGAAVVFGARATNARALTRATEEARGAGERASGEARGAGERASEEVRGAGERSPYHARFRQGATLVPRVLALVEREAGAVRSARSAYEKRPWRDLAGLSGAVEEAFVWAVVLGEHVVPYRALTPALGVLPRDAGGWVEPGAHPGLAAWWGAGEARWQAHRVSEKLTLRGQFDYQQKLSSQFPLAPLRVVYTKSGMHLAAAKLTARAVVDHTLYWASVATEAEADYLCGVLNARTVTRLVRPWMAYGKDERHIDKHVWRLQIPQYDPTNAVHGQLAAAARRAEAEVAARTLDGGWISARREVRGFLADSAVGREIEGLVGELLAP